MGDRAVKAPTIIDGGRREYEVVGMHATFFLRDLETGEIVHASEQQLAELGNHQAALRDSLASGQGQGQQHEV